MASVKKVGWRQLVVSAIGYSIVTGVGFWAIAMSSSEDEGVFMLVGMVLVMGGGIGALVHIVAAGIRLADEDRAISAVTDGSER